MSFYVKSKQNFEHDFFLLFDLTFWAKRSKIGKRMKKMARGAKKSSLSYWQIFDKKVKFDRSNCILRKALKISAESGNIYECQKKQGRNLEKPLTEFLPCFFTSWIYSPHRGALLAKIFTLADWRLRFFCSQFLLWFPFYRL